MFFSAANPASFSRGEILAAMLSGVTVLTPNIRSARSLSRRYDMQRREEGLASWQPARVLPWAGWTGTLWADATVRGAVSSVLMNDLQAESLWAAILSQGGELGLQPAAAVARRCTQAMRLLGGYDVNDQFLHTSSYGGTDTAAFAAWYRDYIAFCKQDGLLPPSHLEAELAAVLRAGRVPVEARYVLYGFDTFTPAQNALVDALRQAGAMVDPVAATVDRVCPPTLVRCEDPHAEIDACCQWIRSELPSRPNGEIAVVVPDLAECRSELERSLRATVAPWLADVTQTHGSAPYEFSTGRPLAHLPMVADALRLLRWCVGPLSFDDAGTLLRSPFLCLSPSAERGAELEAWVLRDPRKLRRATGLSGEISLGEMARLLGKPEPDAATLCLRLASEAERHTRGAHGYAGFADRARNLLQLAGWPGGNLDSTEYQAVQRWNDTLDRVASLDLFGQRVRLPEWVEAVTAAAMETTFAPENTGAPVQVMTPSEAEGSTTDCLWFLHAGEDGWLQVRDPNPLLPRSLQRGLGMPGADPVLDEERAAGMTRRRVSSSSMARFSYAASGAAGDSRPSPIILALPSLEAISADSPSPSLPSATLEQAKDTLPLPALPANAAGGISILASQGQCGFRAFAERRLQLADADSIEAGLSPAERGEIVHAVLQHFWLKCRDQNELSRLTKAALSTGGTERDALLAASIEAAMPPGGRHGWDDAYLAIQRIRLHRLLSEWLDVELRRAPFRVEELEFEIPEAQVGPLRLKIRVDRIDRVPQEDGTEAAVLIDYKTGAAERKDWFGERPDAPQLPVYALAGGLGDVGGIAFGRVRVGKLGMDFQEMLKDRNLLGDNVTARRRAEPTFDERMDEWRRDITTLAEAFARGEAVVEPKDYLTTCKQCAGRLLCRVDIARLEPDDDLLEEAEEETGA